MAVRKWSCFIVYESTFASARRIRTPTSIIFLSDTDALMRNRNSQSETITFQTCYKNKTKTILPSRLRMHPPPPASNPSGILHPNRISYIRKIDSSGAESINFDGITLSLSLSLSLWEFASARQASGWRRRLMDDPAMKQRRQKGDS